MLRYRWLIVGFLVGGSTTAFAQADPKFEYAKPDKPKKDVEWKASAQAGLVITAGNSSSTTITAGASVSRKAGDDQISFDGAFTYARAQLLIANDINMNGVIDGPNEVTRAENETANNWLLKLRYDRFFEESNSGFISGRVGRDEPAGKDIIGGGQIGYSRRIVKDDVHELVGEIGYDFTYEAYLADTPSLSIHSLRAFLGYKAKVSDDTGLDLGVEALFNLNSETGPAGEISSFEDTRVNGKLAVTTKMWKQISLRFSFSARFDNAPAALPPVGGLKFAPGVVILADKLDTTTELALIVNFL